VNFSLNVKYKAIRQIKKQLAIIMQKFGKYISFAVVSMYFVLGILLLTNPQVIIFKHQFYLGDIQPELRIIIGIILLLYGSYRLARLLTKKDETNSTQEKE
jgi:hypothetical protein